MALPPGLKLKRYFAQAICGNEARSGNRSDGDPCLAGRKRGRRFAGGLFGFFFLICSLMILSGAAWGAVTGSISGTVKDPSGRVVPNAKVTARELSTGISHETRSNASGYYTLPVLPVGRYELDVQAPGIRDLRAQDDCAGYGCGADAWTARSKIGEISADGERDRQCAARGDGEHAVGRSDQRARDERRFL